MRKTIYVPSQEVWEAIKGSAEKEGISVSKYIVRKCLGGGVVSKTVVEDSGQLDRIEAMLNNFLKLPDYSADDVILGSSENDARIKPSYPGLLIGPDEAKDLKALHELYPIHESKKVIKTVEDVPTNMQTFRPFTKEHQTGRKAKGKK